MNLLAAPGIRRFAILASVLTASALVPWSTNHAARAADASTLTIAITPEPDTLDPQTTGTAITSTVDSYIGDTLVRLDPKNKIVADLAKSWTISPDGLIYTFNLRQDVTFQDGTPLNAAAYVGTFKRLLDPATKAAVESGQLPKITAITATGTYSFSLRLAQPSAFLLFNLSDSNFQPLSPTALKAEGANFGRKPVSTGPWQVQDWITGSQIVLVRNPHYNWGPSFVKSGAPAINKLVFRILNDPAAQTAALQSGEIDELTLPTDAVARIQASGQYTILKSLQPGARFLEFNITKAPFTDLQVRRALNYAINKDQVVQVAINGLGVPLYGVLGPTLYGYWPGIKNYAYSYNPQKALAILAQDGYVKKNGLLEKNGTPLSFTLYSNPVTLFAKAALVIQDQLKQLGVTVNIQTLDFNTEIATIHKDQTPADLMGYNYNNAGIFYIWFDSANIGVGFNDSFIKDLKLDALINRMQTTSDTASRNVLIQQLERYVSDRALMVPLFIEYNYVALQPRVKGVLIDPRGRVILNNATLN